MGETLSTQTDLPLPCMGCGYDLRAMPSDACPECGLEIDRAALREARIPWQDRKTVGRWRGFWRTVWMALRRPGQLAGQATRPVDYSSARRFQLICVTIAWLALAPPLPILFWIERQEYAAAGPGFWLDLMLTAAFAVGMFLWLLLATGVPSYFFHPKSLPGPLQDRAVALSYYAAGPLALLPVAALLVVAGMVVANAAEDIYIIDLSREDPPLSVQIALIACSFAAAVTVLIVAVDLIIVPMILLARGLQASGGRFLLCGLVTLVGWVVLFGVFVVGLPLLVLYIQMVFFTLR